MDSATAKKYIHGIIIYLVVIGVAQITFSNMWSGEISSLDLFQEVIAPACCFAIASLLGWYKNAITTFISGFWIATIGVMMYLTFQKFTSYSGSAYYDLLMMDLALMGKVIISGLVLATFLNTIVVYFTRDVLPKNEKS